MTEELSKLEGKVYDKAIDAVEFSNILLGLQKAYISNDEHEVGGYFFFKEIDPNHLDNPHGFLTGREILSKIIYCEKMNCCLGHYVHSLEVIHGENI